MFEDPIKIVLKTSSTSNEQQETENHLIATKIKKNVSTETENFMSSMVSSRSSSRRTKNLDRMMNLVKWKRTQSNEQPRSQVCQEFSARILKPNDYFFFSVFTSLFCFLPIGI